MKPDDLNRVVDSDDCSFIIMSQAPAPGKSDEPQHILFSTSGMSGEGGHLGTILMDESVSMDDFKMSPATEALEFLLSPVTNATIIETEASEEQQMDPNSLLVDLNDLLRRDPTLSSLGANISQTSTTNLSTNDVITSMNSLNSAVTSLSMAIPKRNVTLLQSVYKPRSPIDFSGGLMAPPPSIASSYTSSSLWGEPLVKQEMKMEGDLMNPIGQGPPPTYSTLTRLGTEDVPGIKMETADFDDLDALFLTSSSPNVSLGLGQSSRARPSPSATATAPPTTLKNINFWQMEEFPWGSGAGASSSSSLGVGGSKDLLSSSVPATLLSSSVSPLSDILTDLSSPSNAPAQSPSQAGPQRHSTLHKLLMRKETMRPVPPARSPDSRKTLDRIKTSLSSSNPLLNQQASPLSKSAPTSDSLLMERIWKRREPRTHFTSVCSVGESSVTDEVNDILEEMSPTNLQDIVSDDEDLEEDEESRREEKDSSDDSDFEGTSPSQGGKSSGSKKERHFWQYNVQAKGPKGQKILIQTKIEDPHVLNEIVDPVFSGDVKMQGIKHSGKARRGDGNDLTANPKKLAAIGKELEMLSKVINDLTPGMIQQPYSKSQETSQLMSEMPFGARCKSRKEKNKLASRACRLKKKAQHEANKLKLHGLQEEHRDLVKCLDQARSILMSKVDPNCVRNQLELTAEIDMITKRVLKNTVAGATTDYVNKQIMKNLPYV